MVPVYDRVKLLEQALCDENAPYFDQGQIEDMQGLLADLVSSALPSDTCFNQLGTDIVEPFCQGNFPPYRNSIH